MTTKGKWRPRLRNRSMSCGAGRSPSFKSSNSRSADSRVSHSSASWPLSKPSTSNPSRRKASTMRKSSPSSSSATTTRGARADDDSFTDASRLGLDPRNLYHRDEFAELRKGFGEAFVRHRFVDVHVAAKRVAAIDFARIFRRGQHHYRQLAQFGITLDLPEHSNAVHFRHPYVEQEQIRMIGM